MICLINENVFSAKNKNEKSFRDGFSDGFNNILDLDGDVYSVKSYNRLVYVLSGFSIKIKLMLDT